MASKIIKNKFFLFLIAIIGVSFYLGIAQAGWNDAYEEGVDYENYTEESEVPTYLDSYYDPGSNYDSIYDDYGQFYDDGYMPSYEEGYDVTTYEEEYIPTYDEFTPMYDSGYVYDPGFYPVYEEFGYDPYLDPGYVEYYEDYYPIYEEFALPQEVVEVVPPIEQVPVPVESIPPVPIQESIDYQKVQEFIDSSVKDSYNSFYSSDDDYSETVNSLVFNSSDYTAGSYNDYQQYSPYKSYQTYPYEYGCYNEYYGNGYLAMADQSYYDNCNVSGYPIDPQYQHSGCCGQMAYYDNQYGCQDDLAYYNNGSDYYPYDKPHDRDYQYPYSTH